MISLTMISFRNFTWAAIVAASFASVASAAEISSAQVSSALQASDIDAEIASLEERRKVCVGRMKYAQNEGSRFLTRDWLTYRRYMIEVERYSNEINEIDLRVQELKARREQLRTGVLHQRTP